MVHPDVSVPRAEITALCRRHGIRRLAFFGSVMRADFHAGSDVDVLVEFAPGRSAGLETFQIEEELSRLLGGRRVDLVKEKYLSPRLRDRILSDVEVRFEDG